MRKFPRDFVAALLVLTGIGAIFLGTHWFRPTGTPQNPTAAQPILPTATVSPSPTASPTPDDGIDDEVATLRLSQAIGQRIIYSYEGYAPPQQLKNLIARGEAGGVIIFKRNVRSAAHLATTLQQLQSIARPAAVSSPLLMMIDQEGGSVKRLPGPPTRSPREIGRLDSSAVARQEGLDTGSYLKASGINVNLAPLVDVARPGTYQERSSRSYGRSSPLVAKLATAFAAGLQEGGVVPCFKHFPGLGAAFSDEDLKVNRLELPLRELNSVDLPPFRGAGAHSLVMTSTGVYPALDTQPALFSRRIVTGELRDKLGFAGLSITDDLEVPALQSYGSTTERGRRAIEAGNDLLLYCVSLTQARRALQGLTKLYENQKLDSRQLYQTTTRILAFREQMNSNSKTEVETVAEPTP